MVLSDRLAAIGRRRSSRKRGWQSPIAQRSYVFEAIVLAGYIALLYKFDALGLVALLAAAFAFPFIRSHNWKISWPATGASIAYVAMATVTAFLVSKIGGVERTAQGMITVGATASLAKYIVQLTDEERTKFFRVFAILNLIILAHVFIFHVTHGHLVTWKYLRDTKFVFAVIVVLLFFWEDGIKARSIILWAALLSGCTLIVLLSGERKAYLALVACYLLSRARWTTVVMIGAAGLAAAAAYTAAVPDSYVTRQLESGFVHSSSDEIPTRYFFSVSALADHSDLVRTFVNRNAQQLFRQHPILGLGSTGYVTWAQKTYGSLSVSRGLSMNVHGERNRVPVEGGVVGIAIALSFLTLSALRLGLYWRANGGADASSRVRGPAYLYALMFFYIYAEALDTTMLILIVTVGFTAGSLQFATNRGVLRSTGNYVGRLRKHGQLAAGRGLRSSHTMVGSLRSARPPI
jgi:hypothetical protein